MKTGFVSLYIIAINIFSGSIFAIDKIKARNNRRRIPERTLHLLELGGGVFANLLLMYLIRHKNKKFAYWVWTWLILLVWILIIIFSQYKL